MFQSVSKTNSEDSSQFSNDTESFVHVMDIDTANKMPLELKITPRHDTIGLQAKHAETHFCATVTARSLPEDDGSRAPVDIIVALDVSSSMHGRKLDLCKETITLLLRELGVRDRFGLVTFGNNATVQIPTRILTKDNKQTAVDNIKKLRAGGCTNLSGGIGLAVQELKSLDSPNEVQTIFLLTDGLANKGILDRDSIIQLTKGCVTSDKDLSHAAIHCFGYGVDHDREMLRDISQVTEGGTYYFIEDDSEVSSAFGSALGGILSVVAQNTVLTFNASNEYGIRIISILHDKAVKQEDGSFTVSIGDFYAEESRDIICNIVLASGSDFGLKEVPHVSVSMTYMDTINKKLEKCQAIEGLISRPNGDKISQVNDHVALQYIRVSTTNIIADAEKIAATGDLVAAKSKISSHLEYLSQESFTIGGSNSLISQLMIELNNILSGLSSQANWKGGGACYMQQSIQTHSKQRCNESVATNFSYYRTPGSATVSAKFSGKTPKNTQK